MIYVKAVLMILVLWVALSVLSGLAWSGWAALRRRRWTAHVDQALRIARSNHPSRPRGPEDEPRWSEWSHQ